MKIPVNTKLGSENESIVTSQFCWTKRMKPIPEKVQLDIFFFFIKVLRVYRQFLADAIRE